MTVADDIRSDRGRLGGRPDRGWRGPLLPEHGEGCSGGPAAQAEIGLAIPAYRALTAFVILIEAA